MKYDFELVLEEENSVNKILNEIEKDSDVLEFGPASGRMTKYLKEHMGCRVYIVEIDRESAKEASKSAEDAVIGDIEDFEWLDRWEGKKFDYVIFADVLEHLKNPEQVLAKTKILLKEDGRTIISVPNVGHNSILIQLINNVFHYTPVGLLDRTHIHLFAYHTLKMVCDQAGYLPVKEDAVYAAVGQNEVEAFYGQVSGKMQSELKKRIYNNVYQYIFVLQKKGYAERTGCVVEKKIIPYTKDYKFQVFFDRGQGWMEENSISIPIELEHLKTITVSLAGLGGGDHRCPYRSGGL